MKYHDDSTTASDSIYLTLDETKLKFLMPELFTPIRKLKHRMRSLGFHSYREQLTEHIAFGDSQGAIVASIEPLQIAAYNEDIDCIVLLRYSSGIQKRYGFELGDRLVCINTFGQSNKLQADLIPGKNNSQMWSLVHPIIGDLLSSDKKLLDNRRQEIGEKGYQYIQTLVDQYLLKKPNVYRNGKPFLAIKVLV
ncbi:MAG: hypothetical protein COA38_16680 [Fluviicola sp.]|nr:MAG: hypothetical protein COA38_16680 [Fluviicola sp.]